ncbi:hypothetical protein EDC04DRAFT_2607405 [Pisolithus marmoratus]|nr:hypothetical protein EDC04DRAFT_2607405 [Pisolithus marmoratus]
MGDQETGKVSAQDADTSMETSGGKGDDVMDKSLDMGSNSSDASSDSNHITPFPHRPSSIGSHATCLLSGVALPQQCHPHSSSTPQISIPSPPPTAYARPPDPPALHDSNGIYISIFHVSFALQENSLLIHLSSPSDEIFHRMLSSDTKRSHLPSVQPSKKCAASKSLSSGDEETIQRFSLGLVPLHHAPPCSKQKLDGGAPSSGLPNVAEGDEDVSDQLG